MTSSLRQCRRSLDRATKVRDLDVMVEIRRTLPLLTNFMRIGVIHIKAYVDKSIIDMIFTLRSMSVCQWILVVLSIFLTVC